MTDLSSQGPQYVFSYDQATGVSSVWKLDLSSPQLFERAAFGPDHQGKAGKKYCSVGNYLLEYDLGALKNRPAVVDFSLYALQEGGTNPLAGQILSQGSWAKHKFWQFFDHYTWDPDETDIVQLVPMTGYVMAYMPTEARGTYMLWNFDPDAKTATGDDPLPNAMSQQDALSDIKIGSQLLPMGNYVLEWQAESLTYRVWNFDPMNEHPLLWPPVSVGQNPQITQKNTLVAAGDYILEFFPNGANTTCTVWGFDPMAQNPFVGPLAKGTVPAEFDATKTLVPFQPLTPIDTVKANTPGTMDFMRTNIEHVVVYMLESRTVDSVVGWLYENSDAEINYINFPGPYEGNSTSNKNAANGTDYPVYKFEGGALSTQFVLASPSIDPFHTMWDCVVQQFSGGFQSYLNGELADMGGFVANNLSGEVMASFGTKQLPVINGLAGSYAISDMWFSSMPGTTVANRAFALSGSNNNIIVNCEGEPQYSQYANTAKRQPIWKVLQNNGIPDWKIYYSVKWGPDGGSCFTYQLFLRNQLPSVDENLSQHVQELTAFYSDVSAGTLPRFSFVEPAWIAPNGATSYHPGASGDMVPGEKALKDMFEALLNSPKWDNTALVITFSKGGGVYDHVHTPKAKQAWPSDEAAGFKYDVLGPRVPTIVVSPRVKQNSVFRSPDKKQPFEATSLAATLLEWCGVPRARWGMGNRLQSVPTFESVFQLATPRTDKPSYNLPYDSKFPPTASGE